MSHAKIAAILDKAAQALDQAAWELRRVGDSGADGVWNRVEEDRETDFRASDQEEVAARLRQFWSGVRLSSKYESGGVAVDLETAQGRWELVVLAVLMGARVQEGVVERTFERLRSEGLLQLDVLTSDSDDVRKRVETLAMQEYRALGDRRAKVRALFQNAHHVRWTWGGDLQSVYERARAGEADLLGELRRLAQIDRMALWICRTLKVHGVWPEAPHEACCYVDRTVRLPLERLPLEDSAARESERPSRAGLAVIERFFGGDALPLYLQGASLCSLNDVETCLGECPVAAWCSFPDEKRRSQRF